MTQKNRERWPSKLIFIFAAVGSAVGLGNIWRFPYLASKYGGGSFLVPYVIMLLLMGLPLLIMEFALGQKMQVGAVGSFKKIKNKLSAIGFGAVLSGFIVVSYYAVVMAWCLIYILKSFNIGAWGSDTKSMFFNNVLHISDSVNQMGDISVPILLSLIVVWILIYFSIWKGVKSVGKVIMITMPLPLLLLVVLLVRGLTLPGALEGVIYYVKPNWNSLFDFEVWSAAMSQIFFTLSLAFGVMIAYSSYQHESSDIAKTAVITSITNSLISIVAGFAVFSTLGYMAAQSGLSMAEVSAGGPGLAFVVFPKALSMMPMAPLFAIAFFIMLITLGIDSAFSLVEAATTIISDKYPHIRKEKVSLIVCVLGFISGIIFTTYAGLYFLDITDHFITNYGLVTVGLLEVIAVGWLYGAKKLRDYINEVSDIKIGVWWDILIKYVIPVLLVILLFKGLSTDLTTPYENYPQWAINTFGWLMLAVLALVSFIFSMFGKDD